MKLLSFLAQSCALQTSFDVSKRSDDVQADERTQRLWKKLKERHDRNFTELSTEQEHFRIFHKRLQLVDQHEKLFKAGKASFQLELNKFADRMESHQYAVRPFWRPKDGSAKEFPQYNSPLPESVDWRTKGAVSPVKNQRGCQSCYAFAAVGALEGQNAIKYGKRVELSVQNLVDCSVGYGNAGCFGGYATAAFAFVQDYGVFSEKAYPYQAQSYPFCYLSGKQTEIQIEGFQMLPVDEETLKRAVATVGPIAVSLNVNIETFDLYKSGVYHDPRSRVSFFGHAMLLVGYGTDPLHGDYWILKNSDWGEEGYMRLARNRNGMSAIFRASFPIVS